MKFFKPEEGKKYKITPLLPQHPLLLSRKNKTKEFGAITCTRESGYCPACAALGIEYFMDGAGI